MRDFDINDSNPERIRDRLIPPRGDYQILLSFQKAEVIYDITYRFAHKFLSRNDRTIDNGDPVCKIRKEEYYRRKQSRTHLQGGLREKMTRLRIKQRNKKN